MQTSGGRLVALFLESDDNLRAAVGRLLTVCSCGIEPIFVSNGNQALEVIRDLHAKKQHLDVLITDHAHPPGPDGCELIRWIRSLPDDFTMRDGLAIKHLPIVVQSGNRFADKARDVASGVLLLRKPYKFQELLDTVESAVRKPKEGIR